MKRVILTVVATVIAIVALLSFKTQTRTTAGGPQVGLPSAVESTPAGTTAAATSPNATSAPPDPTRGGASSAGSQRSATGSAVETRYGVVQVKVTVSGSHIVSVAFVQLTGNERRSDEINQGAAPILLKETLSAQSAHIDTVSGATYTTDGYIQSLQSALDQLGIR